MPRTVTLFALLLMLTTPAAAEPTWTRLISDDTLAVATAPLDAQAWRPLMDKLKPLLGPQAEAVVGEQGPVVQTLNRLAGFGARDVAIVLGMSDLANDTGFVIAIGFAKPPQPDVTELLKEMADGLDSLPNVQFLVESQTVGNLVLLGSSKSLKRYATRYAQTSQAERPNLIGPLAAAVEQNQAAVVAALDDDSRRVLRELWPVLPPPWHGANASLLADGLRSVTLSLSLADVQFDLTARARDAEQASLLRRLMETARDQAIIAIKQNVTPLDADGPLLIELATLANECLEILQHKNNATARIRWDDPRMQSVLNRLVKQAREDAIRQQRTYKFRQIALAMHNYYSVHGHFPAASALRSKENEPLLSWRVALLPFLENGAIYDEFHLDEPWDSPHNLKLTKRMPEVFADANLPALRAAGKTTFQVPVGEETLFLPPDKAASVNRNDSRTIGVGFTYGDIIDGLSNTVMLIETRSNRAVPWTKPADWEVDLAQPLAGLRVDGKMISGWADGHTRVLDARRLNADEFRKVLTCAGKEAVNQGQLQLPEAGVAGQR